MTQKLDKLVPTYNSTEYGLKCIYKKCINSWNDATYEMNEIVKRKYVNKLKSPDIDLLKLFFDTRFSSDIN